MSQHFWILVICLILQLQNDRHQHKLDLQHDIQNKIIWFYWHDIHIFLEFKQSASAITVIWIWFLQLFCQFILAWLFFAWCKLQKIQLHITDDNSYSQRRKSFWWTHSQNCWLWISCQIRSLFNHSANNWCNFKNSS